MECFGRSKQNSDGLLKQCKECTNEATRNPLRETARDYKKKYGITLSDYDALFVHQGGKCAICRTTSYGRRGQTRFDVDHDHDTGQVRGLLCSKCNRAIGLLNDDCDVVHSAFTYLQSFNGG